MLDEGGSLDLGHYEMSYRLVRKFHESGLLSLKDRIIITSGSYLMKKRGTNLLEIYNVSDIIGDRLQGGRTPWDDPRRMNYSSLTPARSSNSEKP